MDNGHNGAIFSSNPEMDDNLNTENWQESLKEAVPAGMPTPEQILPKTETEFTGEEPPVTETSAIGTPTKEDRAVAFTPEELNPALGQITPVTMPNPPHNTVKPYNPTNIKTTGDYLDKGSLAEIEKLEEKLNQDGDLNSFYDQTRELTEVNLDNSFARKLYQDGGEK